MSGQIQAQENGYILVPQQIITESDSSDEDITKFVRDHGFHIIAKKPISTKTKPSVSSVNKVGNKFMTNVKRNKRKMNKQIDILFKRPMSLSRKIAFVISILVCILTIIVFLWVIPCDWSSCPCKEEETSSVWSKSISGLELKGPITLVDDNLIFMMKTSSFERRQVSLRSSQLPQQGGGLVVVDGLKHTELWKKTLNSVPKEIDCMLIDANLDGIMDCIVITHSGYLAVLSQATGNLLWRKTNNGYKDVNMEFPLIVNDLNGDGVSELVLISYIGNTKYQLTILSGTNGTQLGQPIVKDDCDRMTGLTLSNSTLIYVCKQGERERVASFSIKDLYKTSKLNVNNMNSLPRQHKPVEKHDTLRLDRYQLVIENTGVCPTQCIATINITDETNHTVYTFNASRAYIMQPLILHFSAASGFLLKYWEWQSDEEGQGEYDKDKIIIIRHLQERIVLVMFNPDGTSGFHIVNASQSDIIQLCNSDSSVCQPNLSFQEYSLLLADLDKDGYQDLITYLSTYSSPDKSSDVQSWSLSSKLQVIPFEHDLQKLQIFT